MTDTITLPRAVAFEMLEALTCGSSIRHKCQHCGQHIGNFYAALYAALAEPEQKPEPVAFMRKFWSPDCGEYVEFRDIEEMKFMDRAEWTPLYAALPEPDAIAAKYNELLMAVGQKHPGETRHETALRYITQSEQGGDADQAKENKS
jgi:hypothetical protein